METEVAGKTGEDLRSAKAKVFQSFANVHPDEYAWENGNRKKPTGPAHIASCIVRDMRRVFGDLYEPALGQKAADCAASMYY